MSRPAIERLRIAAIIQGSSTKGGHPDGYCEICTDELLAKLREIDQFNQDFKMGDRYAFIIAEHWPSVMNAGLTGMFAVKEAPIPPWPRRTMFQRFTDALRRVFHLRGHDGSNHQ